MIIFYGEGRLGNQIFQYQALNRIARPGETIVAIGLEDLQHSFDLQGAKLLVLNNSLLVKRIFKFIINPVLLFPLARLLRLFNFASEPVTGIPPHAGSSGDLVLRRGLLPFITFVHGGYYQNPSLWNSLFPTKSLKLRTSLQTQVRQYLAEHVPESAMPIFVHVRRGDYQGYSSYGLSDLMLPETFYRRAILSVKEQLPNAHFVFVTDDSRWVTESFADVKEKCVASYNARFDFALMTCCRGGILSNSTYSLCAALLMDNPVLVIAPQYWFGFRVHEWYPPNIQVQNDRVTYLPVMDPSA